MNAEYRNYFKTVLYIHILFHM